VASPFLDVICCVTAIDDDLVCVLLIAKVKVQFIFLQLSTMHPFFS